MAAFALSQSLVFYLLILQHISGTNRGAWGSLGVFRTGGQKEKGRGLCSITISKGLPVLVCRHHDRRDSRASGICCLNAQTRSSTGAADKGQYIPTIWRDFPTRCENTGSCAWTCCRLHDTAWSHVRVFRSAAGERSAASSPCFSPSTRDGIRTSFSRLDKHAVAPAGRARDLAEFFKSTRCCYPYIRSAVTTDSVRRML